MKKRGRWKGIVTKLMAGLLVSVGGGYLSKLIFEHGGKGSSSTNSLSSSSDNVVSPDSFYDNQATPISTGQGPATATIDQATLISTGEYAATDTIDPATPISTVQDAAAGTFDLASFYHNGSPVSDTDIFVAPDLASSFYEDDSPLTNLPWNAPLEEDNTDLLHSMVDGMLSSFC